MSVPEDVFNLKEMELSPGELWTLALAVSGDLSKKAWTIGKLISRTRNKAVKRRAKSCRPSIYRFERRKLRWLFKVSCTESYSAPYHICRYRVDNSDGKWSEDPKKATVYVSCSCPAWVYSGAAYHATQKGYGEGKKKENRPPKEKDPQGNNFLCKHIIAAARIFYTKVIPEPFVLPADLTRQIDFLRSRER